MTASEITGIIFGAVTAIGVILSGMWFMINKSFGLGRFTHRVEEIDRRTETAACRAHEKAIDGLATDIKEIKSDIGNIKDCINDMRYGVSRVKEDLSLVKEDFSRMQNGFNQMHGDIDSMQADILMVKAAIKVSDDPGYLSMKRSPRRLSELGEQILKDIDGADFIRQHREKLFEIMDRYKPRTALDVENAASDACVISTDSDIFDGIKNYVYNAPSYTVKDTEGKEQRYDLSLMDACFVLSLPLRDLYLEAHPEIPTK